MFDFLLFQPFRFPQNCHLLERVSSQCVPEILYTTAVLLRKQQSFQSVQVTLESALMPQKGRKASTALTWVAVLFLPWFHFLFHFGGFPFHPVASSQRLSHPSAPQLHSSLSGPFVSSEVWLLPLHLPQAQCHLARASASLAFQLPPSSSAQQNLLAQTFTPNSHPGANAEDSAGAANTEWGQGEEEKQQLPVLPSSEHW